MTEEQRNDIAHDRGSEPVTEQESGMKQENSINQNTSTENIEQSSAEWLDIVDDRGNPTGKIIDRRTAHAQGIRHRTAHVWILRHNAQTKKTEILLQLRSKTKDSYPGCYDISSAGHIPAGVDYIPSALRELQEELGVEAKPEELHYCGQRIIHYEETFYGEPFVDNQVSNVYILWLDREASVFTLQAEEVEAVRWMDLEECCQAVADNKIPHCIQMEELDMIRLGVASFMHHFGEKNCAAKK